MAQSLERLTLTQAMISRPMGSSPASGSMLTAQSLEPASDSVSLFLCPSPAHSLPLSLLKINKNIKTFFKGIRISTPTMSVQHCTTGSIQCHKKEMKQINELRD